MEGFGCQRFGCWIFADCQGLLVILRSFAIIASSLKLLGIFVQRNPVSLAGGH